MRLTTIAASAAALALTAGGMAVAVADPGPNGNNTYGLCTAYEARNKHGKEREKTPPPFAALEAEAQKTYDSSAEGTPVEQYCAEYGTHPGGKE